MHYGKTFSLYATLVAEKRGRKQFLFTLSAHLTEAPVQLSPATHSRDVGCESHLSSSFDFAVVSFQRRTLDTTVLAVTMSFYRARGLNSR